MVLGRVGIDTSYGGIAIHFVYPNYASAAIGLPPSNLLVAQGQRLLVGCGLGCYADPFTCIRGVGMHGRAFNNQGRR
jgi:hypothetical protein